MKKTSLLVMTMISISIILSFLEIYLGINNAFGSGSAQALWGLVFAVLVAMWCIEDAKLSKFRLPYDYGAFMYFLWPIVLPYYLCATRRMDGVVMFFGFVGIYTVPFILGLIAFVYSP